jgi:hypothetical protein
MIAPDPAATSLPGSTVAIVATLLSLLAGALWR